MELRKCCNHPFLVDGVEQAEMENLDYKMVHEPTGMLIILLVIQIVSLLYNE